MTTLKVVLLGEGRVGKTSLSSRWTSGDFSDGQLPTQAAAFTTKRTTIDGTPVEVAVWDTAGQERFHALGPIYYRNADAALLVFDVTDADSFRRVRSWVAELRQMVGHDIALAVAANKQDLPDRVVPDERSRGFAAAVGAAYYRTSAKTGAGIEQAGMLSNSGCARGPCAAWCSSSTPPSTLAEGSWASLPLLSLRGGRVGPAGCCRMLALRRFQSPAPQVAMRRPSARQPGRH